MLVLFSTCLHFVHSILDLRLAWWCFNKRVDKFSECHVESSTYWTSQSLLQTEVFFHIVFNPCWVFNLRLALWCFNKRVSKISWKSCWVSDLLDFTKYTWDFPFSPQINNHSILFFFSTKFAHYSKLFQGSMP